jgi:DNA-binding transcriptional LysR family regulator
VAAARNASFTRAAQQLCVTQGAVSRAVARLEDHFGVPLFLRNAQALTLTPEGQQLLKDVEDPLAAIERASASMLRIGGQRELVLSVVPTLASVWLVPRLPDFQRRHPDIPLRFVPYRKDEDFSGPVPDAAVLTGVGPEQWPEWDCTYVIGHEVVPVCHPRRAQARAWRTPADLANDDLLYHVSAPGNWQQWLHKAGAQDAIPNLTGSFDQVSILIQAAMADMGVALVQRCFIKEELAQGRLVMPFDLPIELARGYFLCCRPQRSSMPALAAFRAWMVEMAKAPLDEAGVR